MKEEEAEEKRIRRKRKSTVGDQRVRPTELSG